MRPSMCCRSPSGGVNDLQQFLRGLGMIAQESARLHGPEVSHKMHQYQVAAKGVLGSVHQASTTGVLQRALKDASLQASPFPVPPFPLEGGGTAPSPAHTLAVAAGLAPSSFAASPPPSLLPVPPTPVMAAPPPSPRPPIAAVPASAIPPPPTPSVAAPVVSAVAAPPVERKKRAFRQVAVPATPFARVWGFGTLAASLIGGQIGESVMRVMSGNGGGQDTPSTPTPATDSSSSSSTSSTATPSSTPSTPAPAPTSSPWGGNKGTQLRLSEAQADRLAEGLCRLRGAALKLGQMLSLGDEAIIPPQIAKVLERVRAQADVMPQHQLETQLAAELGEDWRVKLGGSAFGETPVAAASIGQVHRTTLPDGRTVAVKVQYPGVAESIDSDLDNLMRLLNFSNFLPKGLYLDSMVDVAREELRLECDYVHEASAQTRYRLLASDDPDFMVPEVIPHLSTRSVLTTTWLPGVPIDQVVDIGDGGLGQEDRNRIARKLLKLTLKELFEWRFMQTDPNWGNFFYDAPSRRIGLLDFGATREYPKAFVDDYLRLVWAAAQRDTKTIEEVSLRLGFLTGHESKAMLKAHCESGLVVGEPFISHKPFDFRGSGITTRVSSHGQTFADERLTAPPPEVYSLHRKLAGAFLICIRMGAVIPCRDLLEEFYHSHEWGADAKDSKRKVVVVG